MKTIVIEATPCPSCGKPIPAGALAGLCPACLLAQGAETDAGQGGKGNRFQPPPLEEIAKLFPQLEILGLLGAGGMGAVYKARQPVLDRLVALKILPASGAEGVNFEERFNREARALARLSHPNIVAVHEFGKADGLHFFLMEFVDGANLRQLEKAGRLAPREALQIIPQICDALQYAHDEGVVHRDIKPENVLVDRKGRVKIADFGLAKIMGHDPESLRLTAEGQVMGTPHYMAPEQIEKPLTVDHRADIYSLGVVLYEMLTGDLPLGKFAPPSRKFQLDVRLDDVVLRALENDPARRYQNASEVKSQVETITGTPAPAGASPVALATEERYLYWAGLPVVVERDGKRTVNQKERLRAWAIVFGLLTLAFAFVSAVTGRSLMGWLGIAGGASLVVRAGLAALIVAGGVRHALSQPPIPPGTIIPKPKTPWWRSRHVVLPAVLLLMATWGIFQEHSSLRRLLKTTFNRTDVGTPPNSETSATGETSAPAGEPFAAAEQWIPTPEPGEKPDPNKILEEAGALLRRGQYEEALQRHIWYHNHALEFQPSLSGVRLSFALSGWLELSRRYPKARQALLDTRDQKTREFDEGRGHSDLFQDVASINRYLEADDATSALFKRLQQNNPTLARQCIHYAKDALAKSGEYQLYSSYVPDAQAEYERIRWFWDDGTKRANAGANAETFRKGADQRFVRSVSQLIEVLVGAGRKAEAEKIHVQATALVDDPQLKSAVADAEAKVGK